jgi:uncharacterized alpha-E superfamily protein
VRHAIELCRGLLQSTLLHDDPLDFIELGIMLERAGQTARIVDVDHHVLSLEASRLDVVVDTGVWLSILRSCSGWEPFMKRNRGRVNGRAVAAFLILEPTFPRSVRHAVAQALARLQSICPPSKGRLPGERALFRLEALEDTLATKTPETLGPLHELTTFIVAETSGICEEVGHELFGYAHASAVD